MIRPADWALALLVVIGFILLRVRWRWPSPAAPRTRSNAQPTPRPLKPRTPDDCPACRAAQPGLPPASILPKPYSQVKGPRGPLRGKRIATAGYACPNSDCPYFGIIDTCTAPHAVRCKCDQIHALVGYGGHG